MKTQKTHLVSFPNITRVQLDKSFKTLGGKVALSLAEQFDVAKFAAIAHAVEFNDPRPVMDLMATAKAHRRVPECAPFANMVIGKLWDVAKDGKLVAFKAKDDRDAAKAARDRMLAIKTDEEYGEMAAFEIKLRKLYDAQQEVTKKPAKPYDYNKALLAFVKKATANGKTAAQIAADVKKLAG